MHRRLGLILGAILLAAAVAAGTIAADSSSDSSMAQRLEVITKATTINNFVDVGPAGPSPGDIYVFSDRIFLASDPLRQVGHADGRCTLIDPSAQRFDCSITSAFSEGDIVTEGTLTLLEGARSTGAIVGGTGAYRKARGEATVELGPFEGPHHATYFVVLNP